MHNELEMSMLGELSFFLGLHISQSNKGISISQMKYIKYIIKRFKMEHCKLVSTSMIIGCKHTKDDEFMEACPKFYRYMIGSLL
jgi:hypothetical protein